MKKFILLIGLIFIIFSFCIKIAQAQVVINEFSSWENSDDWVEIYNFGDTDIDLTDYIIRDSTQTNKIPLAGIISPKGFAVFGFTNRLNKSGDTVRLIRIGDSQETEVDSVVYGGPEQVCAPGEGETVGRVPDGGNVLERFLTSTKNSTNNATLDPCPTPTPIPTYTPTQTVTPTVTPTSTHTPMPTKKPSATNTITVIPSKQPTSQTDTPTTELTGTDEGARVSGTVLSDVTGDGGLVNTDINMVKDDKINGPAQERLLLPGILIVAGLAAMIYSLGSVIKKNKKRI